MRLPTAPLAAQKTWLEAKKRNSPVETVLTTDPDHAQHNVYNGVTPEQPHLTGNCNGGTGAHLGSTEPFRCYRLAASHPQGLLTRPLTSTIKSTAGFRHSITNLILGAFAVAAVFLPRCPERPWDAADLAVIVATLEKSS